MEQIRARIREKRGVDYTEQQIQRAGQRQAREVPRSRAACDRICSTQFRQAQPPCRAAGTARTTRSRRTHAVRAAPRAAALHSAAAAADPEAVLQPEPADPGAAHPVAARTRCRAERRSASAREAAAPSISCTTRSCTTSSSKLRACGIEVKNLEDARRVAGQPARVQRAAGACARKRCRSLIEEREARRYGTSRNADRATQRRRSRSR